MIKGVVAGAMVLLTSCVALENRMGSEENRILKEWYLPYDLEEISGMTATDEKGVIAAVQDEEGIIFFYDLEKGEIIGSHEFAKHGDYEGIEKVNEDFWVLRSDGTLFQVSGLGTDNQQTIKHKTKLSEQNDCEGLTYFPEKNFLLIACKEKAEIKGKSKKSKKAIYAFDLSQKKLIKEPFVYIDIKKIEEYLNEPVGVFKPSAIAYDQDHQKIEVLSSVNQSLLTIDIHGEISDFIYLDESSFYQPEGLIILDSEQRLISTEGKGSDAKIMLYDKK